MEEPEPERSSPRLPRIFPILTAALVVSLALAQAPPTGTVVGAWHIVLLVVLLACSAFMAGSETALTSLGSWKIRQLRDEGKDAGGVFALLEREPTRFFTTLLIGTTLCNIAIAALVTQIALRLGRSHGLNETLMVVYAVAAATLLILIFGSITPKSIAVHHPLALTRLVIRPVYVLSIVLYPIGLAFTWMTTALLRLLRIEPIGNPLLTENELRLMLRSAEVSGVLEAQEEEMIKGIIDLEETVVREVMTPRVDVVAVSKDANMMTLLELAMADGYSRLPVYGDTIDDICGIAYARDLLNYLGRSDALEHTRVEDIMTPPQYVPETLSILNLLRDMRIRKNHMAVVVDEFGGTAGVVTLEDIIEEITGEIYDETDHDEEADIVRLDDGQFRIQGSAHLEAVGHDLRVSFEDDGEYDTLAGFLIDEMGHIPEPGESMEYQGVHFSVEQADERRIVTVLARAEVPSKDVEAFGQPESA